MNKRCISCGLENEENAKFCRYCGNSNFTSEDSDDTTVLNQGDCSLGNPIDSRPRTSNYQPAYPVQPAPIVQPAQPVQSQMPYQEAGVSYQSSYASTQKKPKKKVGLIIGIVTGVVILFVILICVVAGSDDSNYDSYDDNYYNSYDDSYYNNDNGSTTVVEYTKGYLDGDTYYNEWADIKFTIPENFENADSASYAAYEDDRTECGACFKIPENVGNISIVFEKISSAAVFDEKYYLDQFIKQVQESQEDSLEEDGILWTFEEGYEDKLIGNYIYKFAKGNISSMYNDCLITLCVRKNGDHMIGILLFTENEEQKDELLKNIEPFSE